MFIIKDSEQYYSWYYQYTEKIYSMFTAADFLHNNTSSNQILFLKFTTRTLTVLAYVQLENNLLPKKWVSSFRVIILYGLKAPTTSIDSETKEDEF